jgi:hypothetical protein
VSGKIKLDGTGMGTVSLYQLDKSSSDFHSETESKLVVSDISSTDNQAWQFTTDRTDFCLIAIMWIDGKTGLSERNYKSLITCGLKAGNAEVELKFKGLVNLVPSVIVEPPGVATSGKFSIRILDGSTDAQLNKFLTCSSIAPDKAIPDYLISAYFGPDHFAVVQFNADNVFTINTKEDGKIPSKPFSGLWHRFKSCSFYVRIPE